MTADLRFVVDDHATLWAPGNVSGKKVMSLLGTFHVTKMARLNITLIKFRLPGFETGNCVVTTAGTAGGHRMSRGNLIPAGRIALVQIHGSVTSATREARQDFIADVIFTDNLGDEHRVHSVTFKHRGP